MDATTAAAEPQVTAPEPSLIDKAEDAILAREEAAAGAAPAKQADKAKAVQNEPAKKARGTDLAAIAQREWNAQQVERAAKELQAKYAHLDEAMSKRDLVGVLNHLADKHGVTFADFVKVLTNAEPEKEKTPAEVATETVKEELRKAEEARVRAEAERQTRELGTRLAAQKQTILELAQGDGARWELAGLNPVAAHDDAGAPVLANEYAWKLIEADWASQPDGQRKSMSLEDALDLVETRLREKQSARRPKMDAGKPKPGAKTGDEAAATKAGGKAGRPSFNNRSTSGAATVADDDEDVDDEHTALSDGDAITRAAKRAGIKLR